MRRLACLRVGRSFLRERCIEDNPKNGVATFYVSVKNTLACVYGFDVISLKLSMPSVMGFVFKEIFHARSGRLPGAEFLFTRFYRCRALASNSEHRAPKALLL